MQKQKTKKCRRRYLRHFCHLTADNPMTARVSACENGCFYQQHHQRPLRRKPTVAAEAIGPQPAVAREKLQLRLIRLLRWIAESPPPWRGSHRRQQLLHRHCAAVAQSPLFCSATALPLLLDAYRKQQSGSPGRCPHAHVVPTPRDNHAVHHADLCPDLRRQLAQAQYRTARAEALHRTNLQEPPWRQGLASTHPSCQRTVRKESARPELRPEDRSSRCAPAHRTDPARFATEKACSSNACGFLDPALSPPSVYPKPRPRVVHRVAGSSTCSLQQTDLGPGIPSKVYCRIHQRLENPRHEHRSSQDGRAICTAASTEAVHRSSRDGRANLPGPWIRQNG